MNHLDEGAIKECSISSDLIRFNVLNKEGALINCITHPVAAHSSLLQRLHEKGVTFRQQLPGLSSQLVPVILTTLPFAYLAGLAYFVYKVYKDSLGSSGKLVGGNTIPDVTFDSIAGVNEAKASIMEVVRIIKNPEFYAAAGARFSHHILVLFISIPLHVLHSLLPLSLILSEIETLDCLVGCC